MPKGSSRSRDLILGILFFGGLFALGYMTTQLRDLPGVGERQFLNVVFEDVYGVRREDSVLVYGTRYGRVSRIEPIVRKAWEAADRASPIAQGGPEGFLPNVLMVIELDVPLKLHEGYRIFAEDSNLLGGKVVTIWPGDPGAAEIDPGPVDSTRLDGANADDLKQIMLAGSLKPHPINALGKLVEDNLDSVNEIVENLRIASAGLDDENRKGAIGYLLTNEQARERVENIVAALDEMAGQVKQPGSLMNDLFYETPLRTNLNETATRLRQLTERANQPDTLLGSLVTADSPLKTDIDRIVTQLAELVEKAGRPDSMIGKLMDDSENSIGVKTERLVASVGDMVEASKNNVDSLFYNLFYGDLGGTVRRAADNIDGVVDSFSRNVMRPIESSSGVLGYLINDKDAKLKLDRLISATLGIVEDAREAAPITSLGSFIFGGF
ncbi:MAG: hypothetical protein V2A76_16530 [Planctomycetota bacterium]